MVPAPRVVLAATDLTPAGDNTISWVCAIASGRLVVKFVHVVDKALYPSPLYAHYSPGVVPTPEARKAQLAELKARLRAIVPPDAASRGIEVEVEILEGDDVADALCARAAALDADMIVLGSHRKGTLARVLLGSVENAVLAKSGRAVLLVPPPR